MSKRFQRRRAAKKIHHPQPTPQPKTETTHTGPKLKLSVRAKTKNQHTYLQAVASSVVTLCSGPAGTGKTFMACGYAAKLLAENKIEKVIITRPLISCGPPMGHLPGSVDEKIAPFMRPIIEAFEKFFSKQDLTKLMNLGLIEMWPLEHMRGASISNSLIICDEAQNADYTQLKMLLTRFEGDSKVIVVGDACQSDTPVHPNPLLRVIRSFRNNCHKDISIVQLFRQDIVRHPLIQWIDERLSDIDPTKPEEVLVPVRSAPAPEPEEPEEPEHDLTDMDVFCCPNRDCWLNDVIVAYNIYNHEGYETIQVECPVCEKCIELPDFDDEQPEIAAKRLPGWVRGFEATTESGDEDGPTVLPFRKK